jgi:hypothetical protein
MKTVRFLVAAALLAGIPVIAQSSAAAQELPERIYIEMMPNMVRLLDMDRPFGEVFIGSAEVADTNIVTDRSVTITARGTGQTSIMFLGLDNRPVLLAEVRVVPATQGLGQRPVLVRTFGSGRAAYETHSYLCDTGRGSNGACRFNESEANKTPAPVVTTGPVITSGGAAGMAQ